MWRAPAALAAVAGDRGEADDHGGLLGRQGAELGKAGDERDRGDGSDAGDGSQDGEPPGEARVGADQGLDFRAEVFDRRFSRTDLALDLDRRRPSRGRAELRRVVRAAASGLRLFAKDRQHSAVDAVGLGQSAQGLGEQPRTQRISPTAPNPAGTAIPPARSLGVATPRDRPISIQFGLAIHTMLSCETRWGGAARGLGSCAPEGRR